MRKLIFVILLFLCLPVFASNEGEFECSIISGMSSQPDFSWWSVWRSIPTKGSSAIYFGLYNKISYDVYEKPIFECTVKNGSIVITSWNLCNAETKDNFNVVLRNERKVLYGDPDCVTSKTSMAIYVSKFD